MACRAPLLITTANSITQLQLLLPRPARCLDMKVAGVTLPGISCNKSIHYPSSGRQKHISHAILAITGGKKSALEDQTCHTEVHGSVGLGQCVSAGLAVVFIDITV